MLLCNQLCNQQQGLFLGVLVLSSVIDAQAYPMYFHNRGYANSCTDAPSARIAGHGSPTQDGSILFEVALGGQPVTSLCPGQTYELSVNFGGSSSRAALLTVSGGSLAESNVVGCPGAATTTGTQRVQALKANWVVPCTAQGNLQLRATSGVAAVGALLQNSASFPVSTACAASSCTPAVTPATPVPSPAPTPAKGSTSTPPASQASTQEAGSADTGAQQDEGSQQFNASGTLTVDQHTPADSAIMSSPAPSDDPAAQTMGLLAESAAVPSCPASSLGYQCSQKVAEGVTIHYSGSAGQPGNSCTQGAGLDTTLGNDTALMHFAIESTQPGYAAIGFPLNPGQMVPADAVIGSVDDGSGAVQVDAYRLSSEAASGTNVVKPVWVTGMGAIKRASKVIVCFSRPLSAANLVVPNLNPAAVPIIWAAHTSTSRQEQHLMQGSLTLNMHSGRPSAIVADDSYLPLHVRYAAQIAHGILMVAACCVFMPAGVLIARHKWLFANKETDKLSPTWFRLHQSLQQAAIVPLIASFVVAMSLFYRKNGLESSLHQLYTPHFAMGVAVPGAALLQALLAAVRPGLTDKHRGLWRAAHCTLGYGTVGLGIANCFVGVVLAHDLKSMPWPAWLAPMCILLGLLLLGGVVLEVVKIMLQLQGRYDARTHMVKPKEAKASLRSAGLPNSAGAPASAPKPAQVAVTDDVELTSDSSQA